MMSSITDTMPEKKVKRPVGRPPVEAPSEVLATRVHPDFVKAVTELAKRNRRTNSAEVGVAVENLLLENESLLRKLGVWTKAMDKLKAERMIDTEIEGDE